MTMQCSAFALAIVLLLAPFEVASAQDERDTSAQDEEARNLFEAARTAYAAGRYEVALARFREAYELSGRPALLFNMATAADRLRRDAEALDLYERFLAEMPSSPQRGEVEARIRILREAQGSEGPTPAPPAALTTSATESGAQRDASAASGGSILEEWWLWALLGVVVAGGVAATVVATTMSGGLEAPLPGTDGVVVAALRFP